MPYARRPVCVKNQERFRVKQPFCWSCKKQIPIPFYFFCQTCMPIPTFFPCDTQLRIPSGKIPVSPRATPTRSECQPHPPEANANLFCVFSATVCTRGQTSVCEGGNVSTVARNMCFSPRSKILCRTLFVWSTRQRCRGCGRNVLFIRACLLRQQDPGCDDLRSVCRRTHRVCVKRFLLPSKHF